MASEVTATRVAVFIDWQNTYKTAREAFGRTMWPSEHGNYSPYQLARILAAGNGRGSSATLCRVSIHRGLPSQKYDERGYAANRRQAAAWMKENPEVVIPRLRPLRYARDPAEPPREKGIDVELAIGALEWALEDPSHLAIVFSHDTDLVPAIEAIVRLRGDRGCIETASWEAPGFRQRLRVKPPVRHHEISETVFGRVEMCINYARVDGS